MRPRKTSNKCQFWIPFWYQCGSILVSKKHQNPRKNRLQEASKKWSNFVWICWSSWFHFDTQVGTMLATFSAQEGRRCEVRPCFLTRWRFSLIFSLSWSHLGFILAPFWAPWTPSWLDLGGFWLYVGTILALRWALWAQELALDALVWWGYAKRQDFSLLMIASSFVL